MSYKRKLTREVRVGNVKIGGNTDGSRTDTYK